MTEGNPAPPQGKKLFAQPADGHVSLGAPLRGIIFIIATMLAALLIYIFMGLGSPVPIALLVFLSIIIMIFVSGLRIAAEWERGVVLRFGRYQGLQGPGVIYIVPFVDTIRFVDTRTLVLNIPAQKVITRDNVPAQIDGALFFLVHDPEKAILKIQSFKFAIAQYAQAALRDVVGGLTLDDLLSEREQIQTRIGENLEERVKEWGLHVDSIRLLDIELPEDLKRMMSRQASAEREKRATITKAEGDMLASANLAEAARTMLASPGAMQLRSLQTIDGLGTSASNTVVLFPVDLNESLKTLMASLTLPPASKPEAAKAEASKPAPAHAELVKTVPVRPVPPAARTAEKKK